MACSNYDCISFSAAKMAANIVHQLVDDRGRNKSHLTKLNVRQSLTIWRSAHGTPSIDGYFNPLCGVMMGMSKDRDGRPCPRALNLPTYLQEGRMRKGAEASSVDLWLDTPIIRLNSGLWLNRREIVRFVRDQDAGAHSDPALDEIYVDFKRSIGLNPSSTIVIEGKVTFVADIVRSPVLATVRQIAHELLSSIYSADRLQIRKPLCIIYIYGSNGSLDRILRPKVYREPPIKPAADILIEV